MKKIFVPSNWLTSHETLAGPISGTLLRRQNLGKRREKRIVFMTGVADYVRDCWSLVSILWHSSQNQVVCRSEEISGNDPRLLARCSHCRNGVEDTKTHKVCMARDTVGYCGISWATETNVLAMASLFLNWKLDAKMSSCRFVNSASWLACNRTISTCCSERSRVCKGTSMHSGNSPYCQ